MNDYIDFGIQNISVIVHKNEEGSFYFKCNMREWGGFVLFTSGEGSFTDSKGNTHILTEGSIIFVNQGDNYEISSTDSCSYITSGLDFTNQSGELLSKLPTVTHCTPKQMSEICDICKMWQTHQWDSLILCKIKLMSLYLDFYKNHITKSEDNDIDIEKARAYIHQYFGRNFSFSNLCLLMSLSPSYMRSKFKKYTGVTITEYREKLRISSASEMLESGHFTLAEIAFELGYFDVYHFSKSFKAITGVSPGKYKKNK